MTCWWPVRLVHLTWRILLVAMLELHFGTAASYEGSEWVERSAPYGVTDEVALPSDVVENSLGWLVTHVVRPKGAVSGVRG